MTRWKSIFPEFKQLVVAGPNKTLLKPSHSITIREILSHTSGMAFQSAREVPTLDALTLRDAALSYAKTPLLCDPGIKWQYSNAGINTAGRIVEVVGRMPFEEFLDKRLFTPLGMKDTTFWPTESQLKRLAKPYQPSKDKKGLEEATIKYLTYPFSDHKRQPMPGGGLFSTRRRCGSFLPDDPGRRCLPGQETFIRKRRTCDADQDYHGSHEGEPGPRLVHGPSLVHK